MQILETMTLKYCLSSSLSADSLKSIHTITETIKIWFRKHCRLFLLFVLVAEPGVPGSFHLIPARFYQRSKLPLHWKDFSLYICSKLVTEELPKIPKVVKQEVQFQCYCWHSGWALWNRHISVFTQDIIWEMVHRMGHSCSCLGHPVGAAGCPVGRGLRGHLLSFMQDL